MVHRIVMVAACAFALVVTSSAAAASPLVSDASAIQAATDIAKTYWNATPCAGDVPITWTPLAPTTNATSTWVNPVSAYDAPEQNSHCGITFNSTLEWDWTRFCSVLVHEYGHLSGHPHSTDPDDVMYAYYVKPVAQCEAAAPDQPATQPDLTASTATVPPIDVAAQTVQPKVKRAVLVVVREPRKLRGRAMHRHPARAKRPARAG